MTGKYLFTQHLYGQLSPGKVNGSSGPIPITKFTDGQDILGFAVTYVFN